MVLKDTLDMKRRGPLEEAKLIILNKVSVKATQIAMQSYSANCAVIVKSQRM
jgi:hypothetical protein